MPMPTEKCFVCIKKFKEGQNAIYLPGSSINGEPTNGAWRHEHCAPLTSNFTKAFPNAWVNKHLDKAPPQIEEPKNPIKRRLIRD
jgi:hypothetical protein